MLRSHSPTRSVSKIVLLLPLLALLTLTFYSEETDYTDLDLSTTYSDVELHYDAGRSEELGIPVTLGAQFTSSGELFTGTQRVYYKENDSLFMELYYEDGLNIGSVHERDGDVYRQVHGTYRDRRHFMEEMYVNDVLIHKDIPPGETEDGLGHIRMWHENGQLAFEAFYTGHTGNIVEQGLMTEYDEEGNITSQERYEDGELVEKMK